MYIYTLQYVSLQHLLYYVCCNMSLLKRYFGKVSRYFLIT